MKISKPSLSDRYKRGVQYVSNALIVGLIRGALLLPYALRVRLVGALVAHVIGPLVGYRRSAMRHLAHIYPDMDHATRKQIATACLDNLGRNLIENYSTSEMLERMQKSPITGDGVSAIKQAHADGRPIIIVTGHFGNYDASRAALITFGLNIGGLYRNMSNPYFNTHYVKTISAIAGPMFPQGRRGTAGALRHIKDGGHLGLLFDLHAFRAPVLDFIGQPARTSTSAADMALRHDALLIPCYGIRQPDGLSFEIVVEAPIPHSDPLTMTQAMNDSLSARIRAHPEQWLWVHRRWRPNDV